MGSEYGDYCYALFQLPSGKTMYLVCILDKKQIEQRYGGESKGKMRDISYVMMQWWIPEGEFCSHSPMCAEATSGVVKSVCLSSYFFQGINKAQLTKCYFEVERLYEIVKVET